MRRVIDMSLTITPNNGRNPFYGSLPVNCLHVEPTGDRRPRGSAFAYLKIEPYKFGDSYEHMVMNVLCTTDPYPGTHVETYYPEKWWYPKEDGRHLFRRDVAHIPVSMLCGEAVIFDFPYKEKPVIDAPDFERSDIEVRAGDIVFVRTGYSSVYANMPPEQRLYDGSPGLTNEAAQWLVDRHIKAYGVDARGLEAGRSSVPGAKLDVHRIFHLHNVVLLEDLANLDKLTKSRVYVMCGAPLRIEYLTGAAGRVVAIDDGKIIDLSHKVQCYPKTRIQLEDIRREPVNQKPRLLKRATVTPFTITDYGIDDSVGPEYMEFPSHLGTHVEIPYYNSEDTGPMKDIERDIYSTPLEQLIGTAAVIDLTTKGPVELITARDLTNQGTNVQRGDIVILKTGYTDRYYELDEYFDLSPALSEDAAGWLVDRGVRMLVTDIASVDRQRPSYGELPERTIHSILFKHNIPIVESACNTWLLFRDRLFLACLPLPFVGLDSSPAHVIAVEDW
ncbi:MAG: hypothetical protein HPY71_02985 [Firmicutes bacterium]|nr:hypothetical protein [Bacillota bacterium]